MDGSYNPNFKIIEIIALRRVFCKYEQLSITIFMVLINSLHCMVVRVCVSAKNIRPLKVCKKKKKLPSALWSSQYIAYDVITKDWR